MKNTLYVYTERVITNSVRNKINLKKFHGGRDVWTASRGIKNSSHVVFWFLNFSRGLTSSDDEGEEATRDFSLLSYNLFFSKLYSGVENSWKDIRWSQWGWCDKSMSCTPTWLSHSDRFKTCHIVVVLLSSVQGMYEWFL